MTSMHTPASGNTPLRQFAIVARLVDPRDSAAAGRVQAGQEHVMDYVELTDLVHEAIAESQRVHGSHGHTLWWDAAEAANLILRHVAALTGGDVDQMDSDSDSPANPGVSRDHA